MSPLNQSALSDANSTVDCIIDKTRKLEQLTRAGKSDDTKAFRSTASWNGENQIGWIHQAAKGLFESNTARTFRLPLLLIIWLYGEQTFFKKWLSGSYQKK